jgi:serine protease
MEPMRASILLLLVAPAFAQTTIRVPRDQPTIQAAVDVAVGGDTILVAPGTYVENVTIDGKAIDLRSEFGSRVTVIDGAGLDTVVRMTNGADGSLEGFTIQGGLAPSSGGGIRVSNSSPRIHSCRVEHNQAQSDGGGIQIIGGAARITNCVIASNGTAFWDGGGIHLGFAAGTVITHCTIVDNKIPIDGWGAGIWDATGGVTISNCIVRDNFADWTNWDIGHAPSTRVQYTNFNESQGTQGNIDLPALFVDQASGDLHLTSASPCIGAGLANAPAVPPYDWDGNPRGGSVDMGADQYGPVAYLVGALIPGLPVTVRAGGGSQGDLAALWVDGSLRDAPLSTPWGEWWLASRRIKILNGALGPRGWLTSTWNVPSGTPPMLLFGQGFAGPAVTPISAALVE